MRRKILAMIAEAVIARDAAVDAHAFYDYARACGRINALNDVLAQLND